MKQINFLRNAGFALPFIFSATVYAQNADEVTPIQEQTVVVASRIAVPLREVSASISVLDEQQIEQLGYLSLADTLASLPSISIANNGGVGKVTSVSVRGEAGFRTLVLLDGIDIGDPSAPQTVTQMEHIMSEGISRVEVLRGPHGMSYGADAGGVILISTASKSEDGLAGSINLEGGSYGTQNTGAELSLANNSLAFYLNAFQMETDGFNSSTADSVNPDDDGYENTTVHTKFSAKIIDHLRMEAVYRSTEGQTEYDGCYSASFTLIHNCRSDYDQSSQRLALYFDQFGQQQLAYNKTNIERVYFSEGEFSYGAEGSISKLEFLGQAELSAAHTFIYGLDSKTDELLAEEGGEPITLERDQHGAHLEYQGNIDKRLYLNLGLRRDDNEDFGKHNSWRSGAAWLIKVNENDELKLKASYGTGFRAPSVYEEYQNTFGPVDMPELHEESTRGFDIGVEFFGQDNFHLQALYFQQQVEDEIYYDMINYTGYLQGDGESESSGVELIAEIPLNARWSYTFNYTYTESENNDGSVRSRQPKNSGKLGLLARLLDERLTLAMHLRANADIYDAATAEWQDNYQVLDANIRFAVMEYLHVFLQLENILDEEYESVPGYYATEASAYGGVRFRF